MSLWLPPCASAARQSRQQWTIHFCLFVPSDGGSVSFSKTPNSPPEKRGLVMCRLLTKKTRRQAVGLVAGQVFPLPVNLQFLGFEEIDFFGVARIWMGKTGNGGLATMGVQGRGSVVGWRTGRERK